MVIYLTFVKSGSTQHAAHTNRPIVIFVLGQEQEPYGSVAIDPRIGALQAGGSGRMPSPRKRDVELPNANQRVVFVFFYNS